MPASSIAFTICSADTGRSLDHSDWLPPSGASGYFASSVVMTWGWMSMALNGMAIPFEERTVETADQRFTKTFSGATFVGIMPCCHVYSIMVRIVGMLACTP